MLKKPGLDRDDIIQFAPKTLAFRKGEGNIPGKDGIFPKTEFFQRRNFSKFFWKYYLQFRFSSGIMNQHGLAP